MHLRSDTWHLHSHFVLYLHTNHNETMRVRVRRGRSTCTIEAPAERQHSLPVAPKPRTFSPSTLDLLGNEGIKSYSTYSAIRVSWGLCSHSYSRLIKEVGCSRKLFCKSIYGLIPAVYSEALFKKQFDRFGLELSVYRVDHLSAGAQLVTDLMATMALRMGAVAAKRALSVTRAPLAAGE